MFEMSKSIDINSETYFLYFMRLNEDIMGGTVSSNKVYWGENGVINIDTNIASPYKSNLKYCSTVTTFSNVNTDENFIYYYPNNLVYNKERGNEVQDINILFRIKIINSLNFLKVFQYNLHDMVICMGF